MMGIVNQSRDDDLAKDRTEFTTCGGNAVTGAAITSWEGFGGDLKLIRKCKSSILISSNHLQ